MFDRVRIVAQSLARRDGRTTRTARDRRPLIESLEGRELLATLATIPNVSVPEYMGYQLPLDGNATSDAQTFQVTSSNPDVKVSMTQGQFLKIHVTHTSSGGTDPNIDGYMVFQLFGDLTPQTVAHITTLVTQGFYNTKNIHRIASGFPDSSGYIVQGGSVNGDGTGDVNQPGFPFNDEFNQQVAFTSVPLSTDPNSIYSVAGQLAMANAGSDTNSSQYFITTSDPRFLDYKHTIFGQLVSGQDVLTKLTKVTVDSNNKPTNAVLTPSVTLSDTNPNGVVHVNATGAKAGETATITVTATDSVDHTTTTKTFTVNVTANSNNERAFLGNVQNQTVGSVSTTQGQTAVFALPYVNPNNLDGVGTNGLSFIVKGGLSSSAFSAVTNATATVDSNGIVTVTPNANFTGVINLLVGVTSSTSSSPAVTDYDTQAITLTVGSGSLVNLQPIATPRAVNVTQDTATPVQLSGNTANPDSSQTLTYTIVLPPTHGTISNFDATKGTFTYTPSSGYTGSDTLQFQVTDAGNPTPNLTSTPATVTFTVGPGITNAVRLINNVLVVTPPPRTDSVPNTINVTQSSSNTIQVTVNGVLDSNQPDVASLDRIVVFGTKSSDLITIDPSVTLPTTVDGGHGGANTMKTGGGTNLAHAWFGTNTVTTGSNGAYIVGRKHAFRVTSTSSSTLIATVIPHKAGRFQYHGKKPTTTFYRVKSTGKLYPIPTPAQAPRYKRAEIFKA